MIWVFSFFLFMFFSLKEFLFFSVFAYLESASIFMSSITPLAFCIIFLFVFTFISQKEYFIYLFMFSVTLFFVTLSFFCNSPFYFIVMLELCVYPMSFLILNFSKDLDKFLSVIFMFSINILGSIPFMFFVFKSFSYSDSFSLVAWNMSFNLGSNGTILLFCFLLVLVSKLPLVFFHFWLTKAHVSASGSCSMILASLMLKLGSFGLYKFSYFFLFCSLTYIDSFLGVSLMGCMFFCVMMMRFFDFKYLIACSSILHMSLIFPLVSAFSCSGLIGSLFMMTGHGLVSYYLFFLVTMLYEFSFNRSVDFNKSLESLGKTLMFTLFVFSFMNLGFPPFVNFYSEMFFTAYLFSYSYFSTFMFCLVMLFSIMFTMFMISKSAFGKKILYTYADSDYVYNIYSMSFMSSVFILPFLI